MATQTRGLLVLAVLLAAPFSAAAQESSGTFSGGSVQVGYDNRTCNTSLEGNIRYNSGTGLVEVCTEGSYAMNAVTFDGTNDYMCASPIGAGASTDGDKLSMSFWFRIRSGVTQDTTIIYEGEGSGRVQITLEEFFDGPDNNGLFQLRFQIADSAWNSLSVGALGSAIRTEETLGTGTWYHALFSIDTTNQLATLYINDAVNVRQGDLTVGSGTIDFGTAQCISITTVGQRIDGDIADMWIDNGTYIDFSNAANRRKFINADLTPVYLGADGSLPTGNAPDIFLSGQTSTWHTNDGTAGGFTLTGALADSANPPSTGNGQPGWQGWGQ